MQWCEWSTKLVKTDNCFIFTSLEDLRERATLFISFPLEIPALIPPFTQGLLVRVTWLETELPA